MEEIVISHLDDDVQFISQKLSEYNSRFAQPVNQERLCLIAKRENKILGGLVGGTYWNWLYIELFWVDENERNKGLGTRILTRAEEIAIQRGCKNAHLETHDFQNLEFYKRHNYRIFGELKDLPEGHIKYFLHKRLISQRNDKEEPPEIQQSPQELKGGEQDRKDEEEEKGNEEQPRPAPPPFDPPAELGLLQCRRVFRHHLRPGP